MADAPAVPELREILGALVFGANRPLSLSEMKTCLSEVAETEGGETAAFGRLKEAAIAAALEELAVEVKKLRCGFALREVAGGFRFESDGECGKWLRHLLSAGKPNRLSHPALETLAIIAYRQPVTKATIEGIRGVMVDHVVKMLMEMQLVRIVGRSDLPGRPFLYGTTQMFLEHFGLRALDELSEIEPMLLSEAALGVRKGGRPAPPEEQGEHEEIDKADAVESEDNEKTGVAQGGAEPTVAPDGGEQKHEDGATQAGD